MLLDYKQSSKHLIYLEEKLCTLFDRFIAVTRPIDYLQHKSVSRVRHTITAIWVTSAAIG